MLFPRTKKGISKELMPEDMRWNYAPQLLDAHVLHLVGVIDAFLEFFTDLGESVERVLHILERMGRRGNDAVHQDALGNHRIRDDRAEDMIVLAQVDQDVGRLGQVALHEHRRHARLGHTDIETALAQAVLQGAGNGPELAAKLVAFRTADDLKTLEAALHDGHRERLGVDL